MRSRSLYGPRPAGRATRFGQLLDLDLEAGEGACHRAAHLGADEEAIGEPHERAAPLQPVFELLGDRRPLARDLERGPQLAGAFRVAEGDPVKAARLVLEHVLGDLAPP